MRKYQAGAVVVVTRGPTTQFDKKQDASPGRGTSIEKTIMIPEEGSTIIVL